jgi:hypothetical protein
MTDSGAERWTNRPKASFVAPKASKSFSGSPAYGAVVDRRRVPGVDRFRSEYAPPPLGREGAARRKAVGDMSEPTGDDDTPQPTCSCGPDCRCGCQEGKPCQCGGKKD